MPSCNNYLYYWVIFANFSLNLKQLSRGSSGIQHQQVLFFFFKLVSYKILFTKKVNGIGQNLCAHCLCSASLPKSHGINEVRMLMKEKQKNPTLLLRNKTERRKLSGIAATQQTVPMTTLFQDRSSKPNSPRYCNMQQFKFHWNSA